MPEDTKKDHIKSFAKTGAKAALGAMLTGVNLGGGPVSAGDMNDIGQGVVALYSAPWYSAFQKEFQASVEKYKYLY